MDVTAAVFGVSLRRPLAEFSPNHPRGCRRGRVDRIVFEHAPVALADTSGYERIATPGCSDHSIRRPFAEWSAKGIGRQVLRAALTAYHRIFGLDLNHLSVDGQSSNLRSEGRFRVDRRSIAGSRARKLGGETPRSDPDTGAWISLAEVAETTYTAFASTRLWPPNG